MPTLTNVLGSLLRDIAHARAQGDMFSREVSLEYLRDEIMRLLPVPRAEIRSADVELSFSVLKVAEQAAPRTQILAEVLNQQLPTLQTRMLNVPIQTGVEPATAPMRETLGRQLHDIETMLLKELSEVVRFTSDDEVKAFLDRPDEVADSAAKRAIAALRKSLKAAEVSVSFKEPLQLALSDQVREWTKELHAASRNAVERAERESVRLELGVTREDLLGVPEAALARVKITVDIENYEWTEVVNEDGKQIRKLVLR